MADKVVTDLLEKVVSDTIKSSTEELLAPIVTMSESEKKELEHIKEEDSSQIKLLEEILTKEQSEKQ
jgi:hypothetical protein